MENQIWTQLATKDVLEDARMKSVGQSGSMLGKIMIMEKEYLPGRIKLIFVKEKLGF